MIINVDFDGTLLSMDLEDKFMEILNQGRPIDEYIELGQSHVCTINWSLVSWLEQMKQEGHTLRGWTNRNVDLITPTMRNLDGVKGLFDSFHFFSGEKSKSQMEGMGVDNDPRYLQCCELGGLWVPSFRR